MKIRISYSPDEEVRVNHLAALLKCALPHHKVKKSAGTPPYNHLYFIPMKVGKPDKHKGNT